jgi:L-seryl-tRNA(Ser) seleniumtransferase
VRAEKLRERVPSLEIIEGQSVAGGGSTPDQSLPTWLLAISGDVVQIEKTLRAQKIIARIENGKVVLDLRTVFPEEDDELLKALSAL